MRNEILISCYCFLLLLLLSACSKKIQITFCGNPNNDLYKVLNENNFNLQQFASPEMAIKNAAKGTGVIIIADTYPSEKTKISKATLKVASEKNLRLYIEYPASLPGLHISDTVIETHLERGIVVSDDFGGNLKPMDILGINDCHLLPVKVDSPLIVLGKVAGFDKAVYGIKDLETHPILFKHDNNMIATTKLSGFATGRYGPSGAWKEIWEYVLSWVTRQNDLCLDHWLSYVHPTYTKDEELPEDARKISIQKGVQWYFDARLFVDSSWKSSWLKYQGGGTSPVGPPVNQNLPNGDGSLGIMEGPTSIINYNGTQQYRYWMRADDQGEVVYALSAAGSFLIDTPRYYEVATNLANFVFYNSNLRGGPKGNKNSPVFGLIGWAVTHPEVFYGDDNARCMLGMIGASAYMHTGKWDKEILENILANFRTTGKQGFRGASLSEEDILTQGWKYFWNRNIINPHPHFESWLWACYLWLYDKTNYKPLLEKTKKAIRITMNAYPDRWKWTNGIQQERARMILPLAWLVQIEDTPEHRKWLGKIVSDLLANQVACGAISEELGAGDGLFGRTPSNEAYGKTEAPLIFENGDPVADMLYTCNFAIFSLNEAAYASGNKIYFEAVKKLSDFLTRVQVKSDKFKDIDGAWFRAFDYESWEYWASNADAGWGAWSTLTGWIQSWIVSTQVLVERNKSYWDLTKNSSIDKYMKSSVQLMLENEMD